MLGVAPPSDSELFSTLPLSSKRRWNCKMSGFVHQARKWKSNCMILNSKNQITAPSKSDFDRLMRGSRELKSPLSHEGCGFGDFKLRSRCRFIFRWVPVAVTKYLCKISAASNRCVCTTHCIPNLSTKMIVSECLLGKVPPVKISVTNSRIVPKHRSAEKDPKVLHQLVSMSSRIKFEKPYLSLCTVLNPTTT